jgi:hypothetical protein
MEDAPSWLLWEAWEAVILAEAYITVRGQEHRDVEGVAPESDVGSNELRQAGALGDRKSHTLLRDLHIPLGVCGLHVEDLDLTDAFSLGVNDLEASPCVTTLLQHESPEGPPLAFAELGQVGERWH